MLRVVTLDITPIVERKDGAVMRGIWQSTVDAEPGEEETTEAP